MHISFSLSLCVCVSVCVSLCVLAYLTFACLSCLCAYHNMCACVRVCVPKVRVYVIHRTLGGALLLDDPDSYIMSGIWVS